MAKTICAACGQHIEFPNDLLGREAVCPNCRAKTTLDRAETPTFRIPKSAYRGPAEREPGNSPVAPLAEARGPARQSIPPRVDSCDRG